MECREWVVKESAGCSLRSPMTFCVSVDVFVSVKVLRTKLAFGASSSKDCRMSSDDS